MITGARINHAVNKVSKIFCLLDEVTIARRGKPAMDAAPKNQKDDVSICTLGVHFLMACSHETMSLAPQAVMNTPSRANRESTVTA